VVGAGGHADSDGVAEGFLNVGVDWLVVGLSVASALAFSVSTTLKNASASEVPDVTETRGAAPVARFVRATLRHPLWLGGIVADVVGLALQVTALHLGALALVQPLLVTGLLFALLLRHWGSWRMSRREVLWASTLTGCLIAFLGLSGSVSGSSVPSGADRLPAVLAALVGLLAAAACLGIARRHIPTAARAALIGIAVGVVYAADAALIKTTTNVFAVHGLAAMLASWQLYTVLVLGVAGLFLTQLAFQAGPLTASLPAISTVDPLLSVAIGVMVYDEQLRRGPLSGALLLALLLLLTTSVVQLGRIETGDSPPEPARHQPLDVSGSGANSFARRSADRGSEQVADAVSECQP
jgi:hypothetical protein